MASSAFEAWKDEPAAPAPPPSAATPASTGQGAAPAGVFEPWTETPTGGAQGASYDPNTGQQIVTAKKPFTWRDTWPVKVIKDIYGAVTLPGDVATGKQTVQPATPGVWTEEDAYRQNQKDAETFQREQSLSQLGVRPTSTAFGRVSGPISAIPGRGVTAAERAAVEAGVQPGTTPGGQQSTFASYIRPTPTPGERAAVTAEETVGEPLPVGVVSDKPGAQQATAASQSLPIVGSRISEKVKKVQEKSGEKVGDIASEMTQGTDSRATAGPVIQKGLEAAAANNKRSQGLAFDRVRDFLPGEGELPIHSMPRTRVVLDKIANDNLRKGAPNPEAGLEQFRNIQEVASFNGMQHARSDLYSPVWERTNPGFDAGQKKLLYEAMTADMRDAMRYGAMAKGRDPNGAVAAFEAANSHFSRLADENRMIDQLIQSGGESALGQLIGKGAKKGGDFQTLAKLKQSMDPQSFAQIGGHALGEMGRVGDEFSLQRFSTAWGKMSDEAKAVLYDPQHRKTIDSIVDMAKTINKSLEKTNRSHTAGALITFEVGKTLGEIAAAFMIGGAGGAAVAAGGAATSALPFGVGYLLGNSARASSVRAVLAARAGLTTGTTPAKVAVYNIALRNLAHTLNLPVSKVSQIVQDGMPIPPPEPQQRQERAGGKASKMPATVTVSKPSPPLSQGQTQ